MLAHSLSHLKPKRILVITQRYLGDTLLVTPLIRSLKQAYPDAKIDVLLPHSNTGMLQGNPDIAQRLTFPKPSTLWRSLKLLFSIFQQYDLAISLQTSDRTTVCAIAAGKISLGFIDTESHKNWWKRLLLSNVLVFGQQHAVIENLRFCKTLGIKACYSLVPPQALTPAGLVNTQPYAVLHIMPQWRYKQWHIQGWVDVIDHLVERGLAVVLSGSSQTAELDFLDSLIRASGHAMINMAGQLSMAELSDTIRHAELFIGPDTGITHLAAATGTPVIALFGPTDPQKWAPWPCGYQASKPPFTSNGIQTVHNVTLVQNPKPRNCIPCQGEGCDRHQISRSECLDDLGSEIVIEAIEHLFSPKPA